MAEAHQHDKLERLCRYISRPAVSEKPLALAANEQVRYELKTPYRNGTTHVIFEPLDFIATGSADTQASSQSHSIPRSLCPQHPTPGSSDTRQVWEKA